MKISTIQKLKDFFVAGAGTDQSLPIGACYLKMEQLDHGSEILPLDSMYLGTECSYTSQQIKQISTKYNVTEFSNVEQIVDRILAGKIIATCLGRAEFGPRALGNRSILADPRKQRNIEIINHKIKNRDFWMPFAPVILYEYQNEILLNPKNISSPHMTIGFDTKNGKEVIPAAIHPADGTVRPMILEKEHNPLLWDLLYLFYKKTGVPVLLNTSFNLHGEPIVDNLEQAIRVLDNSGIDTLWISGHIIDKNNF